jgi:hypothetical protein
MKRIISLACVLTLVLGVAGIASAGTIVASDTWAGNGNTYAVIFHDSGRLEWTPAGNDLPSASWWLATITSQGEQDFIAGLLATVVPPPAVTTQPWIGGFQTPFAATPLSDWNWVTGEDFSLYSNWKDGEPNDWPSGAENNEENYLSMSASGGWLWNDLGSNLQYSVAETPIPGTAVLLISGLVGLVGIHRVRRS